MLVKGATTISLRVTWICETQPMQQSSMRQQARLLPLLMQLSLLKLWPLLKTPTQKCINCQHCAKCIGHWWKSKVNCVTSMRFKQHILSLLPEWIEFTTGREIYLTNKSKAVHVIAKTLTKKLTRMMHCSWWGQQLSYASSVYKKWSPSLDHSHQNALQHLLQKRSWNPLMLYCKDHSFFRPMRTMMITWTWMQKCKFAATISQLLIYNTCPGTHHARQTSTIMRGKDQETTFPLYQGLKMHREAWLKKKQVETTQALGLSVSYSRVTDVKQAIFRLVCKHHAQAGVVLPTNLRISVFVPDDVDNMDGQNKGNFSHGGFHGTSLNVTNHISWDNLGISLIGSSTSKLPDSYPAFPLCSWNSALHSLHPWVTIDQCGHYIISSIVLRWEMNVGLNMSAAYCSKESP